MPRNGSGTFTLVTGNPVVSGTIIESTWANSTLADIADSITNSLARNGEGGMTAPLRLTDGVVATPSLAFANETSSGLYRAAAGDVGLAVLGNRILRLQAAGASVTGTLNVSSTASIGGDIDVNGAVFRQQAAGTGYLVYGSNGATNNGLYYDQANSAVSLWTVSTQRLTVDSSGNVSLAGGTSTFLNKLDVLQARSYSQSADVAIGIGGTDNGFVDSGATSTYRFRVTGNNTGQNLGFEAFVRGTGWFERMRIDSSGRLLIGGTASTSIAGETFKQLIFSSGTSGVGVSQTASGGYCYVAGAVSNGGTYYFNLFAANSSAVGSITSNGTSTTYGTSSDYRLKENVAPMTGALDKVAALKPCTYTWKADGSPGQGFIAHELQAVVPDCVTGEKDAMRTEKYEISPAIPATYDKDGKIIKAAVEAVMGEREAPAYQGVDTSFLVATLVAAIQELNAKVEALESIPAA